jgi:geranylgeranyl pyrophosphate synthase
MPEPFKVPIVSAPTGAGIPPTAEMRRRLDRAAEAYLAEHRITPPAPLQTLKEHAATLLTQMGLSNEFLPYAVVILNNTLWRPTVLGTPYAKRLLLMPQCLKSAKYCPAECDTFGLLCKHCGRCVIDGLSRKAEQLGYTVLIAEGSPVVMALIQSGQIEAVVGVSCLPVLEKVFPYMEAGAVPGVAIPLLYDGCKNTAFDIDSLEAILEDCEPAGRGKGFERLRQSVQDWFSPETLSEFFGVGDDLTVGIAVDWLGRAGKHYRPLLTAAMYAACAEAEEETLPKTVQQAAIAVECFHKASLVHDDIEDGDVVRYGQKTLHAEHGVPVALNVGDFLIGEGYRLLANLDIEAERKNALLAVAAHGHRALCIGQGEELLHLKRGTPPTVEDVLRIFAGKTAPAFAVALKIGAILGNADDVLLETLERYSAALGTAYQIRDDLLDWQSAGRPDQLSIVSAAGSEEAALNLLTEYRERATAFLETVESVGVKTLLRRVITKILDGTDRMGCCDEHTRQPD